MLRPFPIVGGAYTDDSLPWSHQETVNYLPVVAEKPGTRSPSKLAMVPGMRVFADIGTGPYRGSRDVEGKRFVVSGTKLYQVAVDGVATELGTVPGTGRVCMTHNQITGGNQVVVGNGSSGYVWNTVTEVFAQITDDAFPGMKSCDFLNQYILGVEPFGRYWFHSALVDATDYNALDEYQAETSPDRIMGLIALHNEVLVFGSRTIEPWTNVPTDNAAFQLQRGSVIESGCAAGNTICKLDNSVFFLTENGQVARLNGYTPQIVSTYAMEGAIKDCDWSRAFAFTWEDKGHTVYYITFPEVGTFGWDVRQGEWHRRKSFGLDRWRLNTLFKSSGDWYGGDYQTGKLYKLDWSYALDGCDPIERIRTTGVIHDNGNRVTVNAFEVRMDAGAAQSSQHAGVAISGAMPDTGIGASVSFQYTITPDYPGQSYTLQATGLPPGLSMNGTGLVTGTPTTSGIYAITISSVDDCGNELSHDDSVMVAFELSGSLAAVDSCTPSEQVLTLTGGAEPYEASITSGAMPAGGSVSVDGDELTFSWPGGIEADTYSFTVTVTDDDGVTANFPLSVVITPDTPVLYETELVNDAIGLTIDLTVPSEAADDDLLIMAAATVSTDRMTEVGGWTTVLDTDNTYIAYKVRSGDTSVSITKTGAHRHAALLLGMQASYLQAVTGDAEAPLDITKGTDTSKLLAFVFDLSRIPDTTPPAEFRRDTGTTEPWSQIAISYNKNSTETTPQIQVFLAGCPIVAGVQSLEFVSGDAEDGNTIIEIEPA